MVKKIGFYIGHGVEIRHFILSGLLKQAQEKGETIIFRGDNNYSKFLEEYLGDANIIYLNKIKIKKRIRLEALILIIRSARLRLKNIGNFHNYNKIKKSNSFKDFVFGNAIVFYFINYLSLFFIKKYYKTPELSKIFKDNNLSEIFILDYNHPFYLQIGYAAKEAGVDVKIIINSLKSFYINDFIPFKTKYLYTWNKTQNELFKQSNFHQNKKIFCTVGNPYHNFIFKPVEMEIVSDELKQLHQVPFIVYTLIYEKVYPDEYNTVLLINNFINDNFKINKPKIVIRRNPFEETPGHIDKIKELNNIIIAPHFWERDAPNEWSIQSFKGEMDWKYLLSKARLLINITSMAAIESILSGTPVINIGFNGNGTEALSLQRFTNAPFQQDIQISPFVKSTVTFQDFKNIFFELYNAKENVNKNIIINSMNISLVNDLVIKNMISD